MITCYFWPHPLPCWQKMPFMRAVGSKSGIKVSIGVSC